MKNLQNKQSFITLRHRYRISLNCRSINKQTKGVKPLLTNNTHHTLSQSEKKSRKSLSSTRKVTQTPNMCSSVPTNQIQPISKNDLLLKMTSLSQFISYKGQSLKKDVQQQNQNLLAFKQLIQQQILLDTLAYLEKKQAKYKSRTILRKKQKKQQHGYQFMFQRSNTV